MTHPIRARLEALLPQAGQGSADGEPLVVPIAQSTTFCRDGLSSQAEHRYFARVEPDRGRARGDACCARRCTGCRGLRNRARCRSGSLPELPHRRRPRRVLARSLRRDDAHSAAAVPSFGVETDFVDTTSLEAIERALRPNTRLVFLETPSNPTLDVTDLAAVTELARQAGVRVAVDNTFLTPLLQQPLELGADFSIYSTTKFVEGHSAALGGAIVTRNPDDLERLRFVRTCNRWHSESVQRLADAAGPKDARCAARTTVRDRRATGRMVAEPPGRRARPLPDPGGSPSTGNRGAAAPRRARCRVSFELASGTEGAQRALERVELCRLVEHVGSVQTLLTHSATMTHGAVPRRERELVGVTDGLLRISVGLEPLSAITADLDRAFRSEQAPDTGAQAWGVTA